MYNEYETVAEKAADTIKIFSDIELCLKKIDQLENRLRPILTAGRDDKEISKPQLTDLDGAIINLQDRISGLHSRVSL